MKGIYIVLLLTLLLPSLSKASEIDSAFDPLFSNATKNIKLGKYKGQVLKNKASGIGIIKQKDGTIYYGDVKDGVPDGYGVMLNSNGLRGLKEVMAYCGRFRNGIKDGKARCYDLDGMKIYEDVFKEDKPVKSLEEPVYDRYFTIYYIGNDAYVGELSVDFMPEGQGIIIDSMGGFKIGQFQESFPKDFVLLCDYKGDWELYQIADNNGTLISSSNELSAIDKNRSNVSKQILGEAFGKLSSDLQELSNNISTLNSTSSKLGSLNSNNNESSENGEYDNSINDQAGFQQKYDYWGGRAYHTYKEAKPILNKYYRKFAKEVEKDGKVSLTTKTNAMNTYNGRKRLFDSHKDMMMRYYNDAQGKGFRLNKHKAHNLQFDYKNPRDL